MRSLERGRFRKPPHSDIGGAEEEWKPSPGRLEAMERFADRILADDDRRRPLTKGKLLAARSCPICCQLFAPRRADVACCFLVCFHRAHDGQASVPTAPEGLVQP